MPQIEPTLTLYDMRKASQKKISEIVRTCQTTHQSLRNWEKGDAVPNVIDVNHLLHTYNRSYYELDLAPYLEKKAYNLNIGTGKTVNTNTPLSLHEMRKKSGFTGEIVAMTCNTSYRSIRNWESGRAVPNIVRIAQLLAIYGYSFYDLDLTLYYETITNRMQYKTQRKIATANN